MMVSEIKLYLICQFYRPFSMFSRTLPLLGGSTKKNQVPKYLPCYPSQNQANVIVATCGKGLSSKHFNHYRQIQITAKNIILRKKYASRCLDYSLLKRKIKLTTNHDATQSVNRNLSLKRTI